MPEFLISVFAAVEKTSDVSLGIIIGSNLFTLLFILGMVALIYPFHVKMVIEERESTWMLLSGAILLILASNGISRFEGLLLILTYFPYIFSVYVTERKRKKKEYTKVKNGKVKEIFILIFYVGMMVVGGELVVKGSIGIAEGLKIPPFVIGLVMLGIGSSVPETTIGVMAALKKKIDITLGDVYGTNIFTLLFILGISAVIHPIPVTSHILRFTIPYFLFATIVIQFFMTTGHKVGRIEGTVLVLLYIYFVLIEFNVIPNLLEIIKL